VLEGSRNGKAFKDFTDTTGVTFSDLIPLRLHKSSSLPGHKYVLSGGSVVVQCCRTPHTTHKVFIMAATRFVQIRV